MSGVALAVAHSHVDAYALSQLLRWLARAVVWIVAWRLLRSLPLPAAVAAGLAVSALFVLLRRLLRR